MFRFDIIVQVLLRNQVTGINSILFNLNIIVIAALNFYMSNLTFYYIIKQLLDTGIKFKFIVMVLNHNLFKTTVYRSYLIGYI